MNLEIVRDLRRNFAGYERLIDSQITVSPAFLPNTLLVIIDLVRNISPIHAISMYYDEWSQMF